MLHGEWPFKGRNKGKILKEIVSKELDFNNKRWHGISQEAKEFIYIGLCKDQRYRPNCNVMNNHPWLKDRSKNIVDQRCLISNSPNNSY